MTLLALWLVTGATQPLPPVPEVMKELRAINSASYRGQTDQLRYKFSEAAKTNSRDPMPRIYLAWFSLPSDDAWNQLKAVAALNPDNPWVHYGMGLVYVSWKMKDQAKQELNNPLSSDPKFYPALIGQGQLLLRQNDAAGAAERFKAALAIADDPEAHAGLGLSLLKQDQEAPGMAELKKAIDGWPDQPDVLQALLAYDLKTQDKKAAADVASHLADLRPRDRAVHRQLADLRFDDGDKKAAAAEYEKTLRLGDPEVDVLKRLEAIYRDSNDNAAEDRVLQQHQLVDKTDPAPCMRRYELAMARNAPEVAEQNLTAALTRDPKLGRAHVELAKLEEKRNHVYKQIDELQKAAEIGGEGTETAKADAETLLTSLKLPKVFKGGVEEINWGVSKSLGEFFAERKRLKPSIGGTLKVRVKVNAQGAIEEAEVVEDDVSDPLVTAHAYFALKQAGFPKKKREPVFEFDLKKGK